MTMTELEPRLVHASELYGSAWLNGPPVSIRENIGRVILIDFWDYTSVNCLRAIPYVQSWYKIYRDSGLLTVGVHTPEFKFGSEEDNVRSALLKLGVEYPIVLDNDSLIWSAFSARTWPTRVLIDRNGYVRFTQRGEGGYLQFERAIQVLLRDAGFNGELPELMDPLRAEDEPGAVCFRQTGDLRSGYLRGAVGNIEGYSPESAIQYRDPGFYVQGRLYLDGPWMSGRECVEFVGKDSTGTVRVPYEARDVNVVLGSPDRSPIDVFIEQDGINLDQAIAGSDVIRDDKGRSFIRVGDPRMYHLIANPEFGSHLLTMTVLGKPLDVYAVSFVTSVMIHPYSSN